MRKATSIIMVMILAVGLCFASPSKNVTAQETQTSSSNYLAFTSDMHGMLDNLAVYTNALAKEQLPIEQFTFGGDQSDTFTASDYTTAKQTILSVFPAMNVTFTMGNHEWKEGDEDQFKSVTGATRVGWQVRKDDYQIYAFSPSGSTQQYTDTDINTLAEALKTCDVSKPVFIVSHFPLHIFSGTFSNSGKSKTRETTNAVKVINLLNKYPNVVMLWGHNHTLKDSAYGTIKQSGDSIKYSQSKAAKKIRFTYVNMGCMKDGAGSDNYGVVAKLFTSGSEWYINYTYRNLTTSLSTIETGGRRIHTEALENTKAVIAKKILKVKKSAILKVKAPTGYKKASTLKGISKTAKKVYYKVTFASSNKKTARITKTGKIKAIKKGKAVITTTITLNDTVTMSYKTKVTVKK